jgi:hypothetical protein
MQLMHSVSQAWAQVLCSLQGLSAQRVATLDPALKVLVTKKSNWPNAPPPPQL